MGSIVKPLSILTIRNWGTAKYMTHFGHNVYVFPIENRSQAMDSKRVSAFYKYIKTLKPDVFFISKEDHLPGQVFYAFKRYCPNSKIVMLYWDQRGTIPHQVSSRRGTIDSIIINNADPRQFSMYKKFGIRNVYTLYDSANASAFYPMNCPRRFDLFFGGSHFGKFPMSGLRYKLICNLKRKFKMDVRGTGWPFVVGSIVRKNLYSCAIQRAKINIGINHYNVRRYYEERLVECMTSGRMHMTHYIPGMETDFVNHRHLVWFKTIDECESMVKFYLKNESKRERVAALGRERILSLFNTEKTMRRLSFIFKNACGVSQPSDEVRYI
jgi:spore maturation protein CgeB